MSLISQSSLAGQTSKTGSWPLFNSTWARADMASFFFTQDNAFGLGQCHKLLEASWVPHLFHDWSTSLPEAPFIRYLGVGNAESLIVNNITAYREILQTKCTAFVKPDLTRKTAVAVIGEGLPFAEGHTHRIRRGVLNSKPISLPPPDPFAPVYLCNDLTLLEHRSVLCNRHQEAHA
jgi:hypothetical protein